MHLKIRHTTRYTYAEPVGSLIQALRLTPRSYAGLVVHRWSVSVDGRSDLPVITDGFGNLVHTHTLRGDVDALSITVDGEVETSDTFGMTKGAAETLPPLYYLCATEHTQADAAIASLAERVAGSAPRSLERLHALMLAIRAQVRVIAKGEEPPPTAREALAQGRGVARDHAHVFIAACKALEIPARYVSGYRWTSDDDVQPHSHAWAEAHLDGLGWIGFDASQGVCPTESYVRIAIGRDDFDCNPVRGVRRGGADEMLDIEVQMIAGIMAQQQ
jgi:transglutaminase-like putative cysteine protease